MERRVLKLEVIERNAGAVRFKIAEQSHFGDEFCKGNTSPHIYPFFGYSGTILQPGNWGSDYEDYQSKLWVLASAMDMTNSKNRAIICSKEIYDNKIVPAVKAYNDTNGGFGFDDVCPACGQEIKEWRPGPGEEYYFIDLESKLLAIEKRTNEGFVCDKAIIESGNAFKTEELAEVVAEKVKEVLRGAKHG